MDDGCSPTVGILIFAGFVILDFVVFGFIAAMQNLNEAAIERLAGEEDRGARLLRRYADKNERYTHVCELVVLIVHMLLGFLEVPLWRAYFLPEDAGSVMSVVVDVLIFVILILIVLVFGIYTPQKVASRKPEAWALRLAGPVHVVELLFYPIIFLTDGLANLLARVFGVDPLSDTDDVTEEEIISMVNEGHEQGVLLASEAEMIHNIFEFGDKEAKDIMTHRKNICALDGTRTFRQALEFIKENNYSRFPVFLDDIDNIIGVLHIKEALELSLDAAVYDTPVSKIKGLIREVDFIPETRNINSLFAMMQAAKSHLVIVVDEYGQTAGIVAMEDILEEIVLTELYRELMRRGDLIKQRESLEQFQKEEWNRLNKELGNYQTQYRSLQTEKDTLYENYAVKQIEAGEYRSRADGIALQMQELSRKIEETELAFGRFTEEYNRPKQDIKEIIRFSQMEKLTQEAVDVFIKKVIIYRDKRVEIEWNYAFGEE